ncbi:tripartite tricarboxylate transporter TctB family protein [Palleronia sp.]|uniref:tripartite tricarboxylate transporter TctB family protein n=1 Tax=Palleronia sp. TaxID=1940284 RepID=UPI0035C84E86
MAYVQTLKDLFKRYRRPGDLVFATVFFLFSLVALLSLGTQVAWVAGNELAAQPAFWPTVAVGAMVVCAGFHLAGSLASPRISGRWAEVWIWVRSFEYAAWFMLYVLVVPRAGYLVATVIFAFVLSLRAGYRRSAVLAAMLGGVAVVVIFKGLLGVHVPGGDLYRLLPPGPVRTFLLSYL